MNKNTNKLHIGTRIKKSSRERVAFQRSMSLSQLVTELLEAFCEEGDSFFEEEDEIL